MLKLMLEREREKEAAAAAGGACCHKADLHGNTRGGCDAAGAGIYDRSYTHTHTHTGMERGDPGKQCHQKGSYEGNGPKQTHRPDDIF